MSLINDALKRAKQSQKNTRAGSPRDLQYKSVDPAVSKTNDLPIIIIIGTCIVLGMIILTVSFIWIERSQSHAIVAALPEPVAASTPSPVPAATLPAVVPAPTVAPAPATTATVAAPAAVPIAEPPKPVLPALQGILFSRGNPSAVLNGETVFVGDQIGDFQVVTITKDTVTISRAGQTNVLSMQ